MRLRTDTVWFLIYYASSILTSVSNSVMATDLGDAELKELRNRRWARAFTENESSSSAALETERDAMNRKATIVIEHLIQAADVAHTCQHWRYVHF